MRPLILILLFFVPFSCFSGTDSRINLYNDYFQNKDFVNALSIAESLVASFPDSMEFHREKAKMLAANGQQDAFFQEMKLIRNARTKDNISTFFSALSHDLVKRELREELRRFYHAAKDTEILLDWPSFSYETVIDCKKIITPESSDVSKVDSSIDVNSRRNNASLLDSDPSIDMIRRSVSSLDRSVSIGEAVAGYKFFKQVNWRFFVDVQNRRIVEMLALFDLDKFSGIAFNPGVIITVSPAMIAKAKQKLGGDEIACLVRFAIAKDESSFGINFEGIRREKRGSSGTETSPAEIANVMNSILKNQPILVIAETIWNLSE
ncbi:MAG TPA: hypothetical protein PLM07_18460 [Candidatus Rifleibacterium sp.]|nr:hypothetical protein [Candidatus Rifleibacterium sp.]HPT47866.1 hypothetical protein [Candidatus Rifleibacterium sp.]